MSSPTAAVHHICEELRRHEVEAVFGLMGDGNLAFIPHLQDYGIAWYGARHESGAMSMADAYSRVTGRVGVCTVTHGVGLTHSLSALVEATKAGSSVLFLLGEQPTSPTTYICQGVDQGAILRAAGCATRAVASVGTLARDLAGALEFVSRNHRPLTLRIPSDIQWMEAVYSPVSHSGAPSPAVPPAADLEQVASSIAAAERPLFVAGRGAVHSDARLPLERLAERAGALLGTTALAKGLFAGNPFSVDVVGGYSSKTATELIRESDLVLAFGTSLQPFTTRAGKMFAGDAQLIQVDSNVEAIGATVPVQIGLVGDVTATADALDRALAAHGGGTGGVRSPELAARIEQGRVDEFEDFDTPTAVDPRRALLRLAEIAPTERTLTFDTGYAVGFAMRLFPVVDERGLVFQQNYQCLGLGLPGSVGAAIGRPDRLSVLVAGDGSVAMSLGELDTAVRLNVPLLVFVINDGGYGAELHLLKAHGMPTDLAYLSDLDFAHVGRALGGNGITVRTLADLDQLSDWIAQPEGLMVVDCKATSPTGELDHWVDEIWHEPRPGG